MEKVFGLPATELAISMAIILAAIFILLVIGATRRFILVKMGTRNIPRRKGQSSLIVIGLMLSSAIIATSLGIGDTVRYSVRSVALDFLGPTDEIINGPGMQLFGDEYFDYSEFQNLEQSTVNNPSIDGLIPLIEISLPPPKGKRLYLLGHKYPGDFYNIYEDDNEKNALAGKVLFTSNNPTNVKVWWCEGFPK